MYFFSVCNIVYTKMLNMRSHAIPCALLAHMTVGVKV